MGQWLFVCKVSVADLQHVRIIPTSFPCKLFQSYLFIQNWKNRFPFRFYFCSSSPGVANIPSPLPDTLLSPAADWEKYRSSCFVQSFWHCLIPDFCGYSKVVAVIILQIIDSEIKIRLLPLRISFGIKLLESITSRPSITGIGSSITINSKLKSFAMYIFWKWFYTRRKFTIIGKNNFRPLLPSNLPAIIQIHVNVPFFIQSKLNYFVCSLLHDSFIGKTLEQIPPVPSHWRSFPDSIVNAFNKNQV